MQDILHVLQNEIDSLHENICKVMQKKNIRLRENNKSY